MKIHGLQKMTLLDYPGRVACTVFLGQCNFRCPYCHNFELVDGSTPPVMETEELYAFLEKRRGLLDGVVITGGEPCLHRDLPDLIMGIRRMGYSVKLDTNGSYPAMLARLLREGLVDYVAMDIKNAPEKYAVTAGLRSMDTTLVRKSLQLLLGQDRTGYEFRTTVVAQLHTAEDFEAIGRMIKGAPAYYLQPFTDRETVPFGGLSAPSAAEMERYAEIVRPYVGRVEIRGMDTGAQS